MSQDTNKKKEVAVEEQTSSKCWRDEVPQRYRSEEVNETAKVLASLEPTATVQSKLMLASQFENKMFQETSSFNDYRKKIKKKLKKMQQHYHKTALKQQQQQQTTAATAAAQTSTINTTTTTTIKQQTATTIGVQNKEEVRQIKEAIARCKRSLLYQHGTKLKTICQSGPKAVKLLTEQHGASKGGRFGQHISLIFQYALDIGSIVKDDGSIQTIQSPSKPMWSTLYPSPADELRALEKMGHELNSRLNNIWYYVLKSTQVDLFLLEKVKECQEELLKDVSNTNTTTESRAGLLTQQFKLQLLQSQQPDTNTNKNMTMEEQLDAMKAVVPVPRCKQDEKNACIQHLDKIRRACQFFLTLGCSNVTTTKGGEYSKGSLEKVFACVMDSIQFLSETYKELELLPGTSIQPQPQSATTTTTTKKPIKEIALEDVWNKVMEYDKDVSTTTSTTMEDVVDDTAFGVEEDEPERKKPRKQKKSIVIRSKVLLRPGRNPPSHLVNALKSKGAVLCHYPGGTTTLKMMFGTTFEMEIHVSPLLVTIRAATQQHPSSYFSKAIVNGGLPTWSSPYIGLDTTTTTSTLNYPQQSQPKQKKVLRVMGISGTVDSIGPLVVQKLEYASAQATFVLRRCFADIAGKAYNSKTTADVEVLEGTAVLKFVTNARTTYTPDWI